MKKKVDVQDDLLRVPEFCQELEIKISTGRDWVLRRRVDVIRVGRAVRIPRSEVTRIREQGFTPRLERSA
jgi:excisionase family DNA binding protein